MSADVSNGRAVVRRCERISQAIEATTATRPSTRRRGVSSLLSLLASCSTAGLFVASFSQIDSSSVRRWLILIAAPAVAVTGAAAVQYRWGRRSGAGAAAAVLLWVFVLMFNVRAGSAFFPAAVLQTVAWYASRPT